MLYTDGVEMPSSAAISVAISAFNSLTLSPALAAIFLRPRHVAQKGPFGAFNRAFGRTERAYESMVGWLVRRWYVALAVFSLTCRVSLGVRKPYRQPGI